MPTWSDSLKRWLRREGATVKASGAQTSSTTGASVEVGDAAVFNLLLDVTAASGTTPTLDITIQGSDDGTNWYALGTFAQKTGVSAERKAFPGARYVRYVSTIGGTTPSFTFSIAGTAA
ncbi:MAG: hypothetical protein ACRD02_06040 [Acidimicrobiia bacterium]